MDAMTNTLDGSKENCSSVPLMVVENGCGSPCIDLRQVSSELASAAKHADLVCYYCSVIGRANIYIPFLLVSRE